MKGVVASVMHTGTWFTLNAIERLTGKAALHWLQATQMGVPFEWLQIHVADDPLDTHAWDDLRFMRMTLLEAFVERSDYPVVIPLRDPVLALIGQENRWPHNLRLFSPDETRQVRNQRKIVLGWRFRDRTFLWIVNAFRRVARWKNDLPFDRLLFLPVDLPETLNERWSLVCDLADFVTDESWNTFAARQIASTWPIINPTDDRTGLKAEYLAGEHDRVREVLKIEIDALLEDVSIRTLYEDLGYHLPWMEW